MGDTPEKNVKRKLEYKNKTKLISNTHLKKTVIQPNNDTNARTRIDDHENVYRMVNRATMSKPRNICILDMKASRSGRPGR